MRSPICTDIHGNRHAFEAVIAAAEAAGADELWCLGDLVGYGAEPDACVALAARALRDLPGRQPRPRGRRGALAGGVLARRRARRALDAGGDLPRDARVPARARAAGDGEGFGLFHASPRDPIWEYVLSGADRRAVLRRDRLPRLASSATRTSRSPSTGRRASRRPARRGARATELDLTPASGWSTPARPASRATATRAPPGCCSTPRPQRATLAARGVRHRGRPGRDPRRPDCRTRWPNGCNTDSDGPSGR